MITKTSTRVDSLPDDLRAIAKDMLSEKFPHEYDSELTDAKFQEVIDSPAWLADRGSTENIYPIMKFNSDEEEWVVGAEPNTMIVKPRNYGRSEFRGEWEAWYNRIVDQQLNYKQMYYGVTTV